MDKLPVELLTYIAFFACTDGGKTGCSLSLVSRRVRDASRPARFFSVSLVTSPAQIEQFFDCLQKERARSPLTLPRVRHLCLSLIGTPGLQTTPTTTAPSSHSADISTPIAPPKSRAEFIAALQRRTQQWRSTQDGLDAQYARVVPALIRIVSSDLHTLALVQAQWRSAAVGPCFFPALRELTLLGGDPSFCPLASAPDGRPMFPALTHLHHILAWVGRDIDFLRWAAHAPNVTHLRVSRLDQHPPITVDTFDQAINDSTAGEYFPRLERVIIEPQSVPAPTAAGGGAALAAFRDFLRYVDQLAERARVPVMVLPPVNIPKPAPGEDRQLMAAQRVKRVWIQRVDGAGVGCWLTADDDRADM